MEERIEIWGNVGRGVTLLLVGFAGVAAAVFQLTHGMPLVSSIVFLAIAALAIPSGASDTIFRRPRVLATEAGVRFSGGPAIPWSEVTGVYAAVMSQKSGLFRPNATSIAFDFTSKRALRRLPLWMWPATVFSVGDIDLTGSASAKVLASRLEAMRTRVLGTVDGVTPGAGELPRARML